MVLPVTYFTSSNALHLLLAAVVAPKHPLVSSSRPGGIPKSKKVSWLCKEDELLDKLQHGMQSVACGCEDGICALTIHYINDRKEFMNQ